MSTRKTILDSIKTWLEAITTGNGYNITVAEVRRGIHFEGDLPNRPALCFWNDKGPKEDLAGGQCRRTLHLWIWGYIDIQPDNYDNLDNLVEDVEACLNDSHADWPPGVTEVEITDAAYYEGGASDPAGIFEMEASIVYEYDRSSP